MDCPDFSDADWDQYFDEADETSEYDEMVERQESDDPLTMALIATRDD